MIVQYVLALLDGFGVCPDPPLADYGSDPESDNEKSVTFFRCHCRPDTRWRFIMCSTKKGYTRMRREQGRTFQGQQ